MNSFDKINKDLEVHGLQLEQSLHQWYVIDLGMYGRGPIHGYFRYNRGDELARSLTVYKTSDYRDLLVLLNTTIWECYLTGGHT